MAAAGEASGEPVSAAAVCAGLADLSRRAGALAGAVDLDGKRRRLAEIEGQLTADWEDREQSTRLLREQSRLREAIEPVSRLAGEIGEVAELAELAGAEEDAKMLAEIAQSAVGLEERLAREELRALLDQPHDACDCFVDVQFGAGGDESQDWARMLCRMYTGYASARGWKVSVIEETPGDHGIKSCTLLLAGVNAYGYMRTETGIHRLVRKSPFDSNHRRHTTFASVFAYPVIESGEKVQINPADLRVDTYRASGAGGQHVNTTDSAVRITHRPTGIVVQCQNDRSQHKNRATALAMLQSRLELLAEEQAQAHKRELAASKDDIGWGSQIRSYVLDQSRVKDLRTGHESGNPTSVLDGSALGRFIEASLRGRV